MMKKRRMMLLKMREIWTMISKRTKRQKKTMLLKEKEIRKKQWPDIDITYYQTC